MYAAHYTSDTSSNADTSVTTAVCNDLMQMMLNDTASCIGQYQCKMVTPPHSSLNMVESGREVAEVSLTNFSG